MKSVVKIASQKGRRQFGARRRGVYVLELVLILPIILLVLMILFQVSVMLSTYQSLRMAAFNAAEAFAVNGSAAEVQAAIENSVSSYYYARGTGACTVLRADSSTTWATSEENPCQLKFRLLTSTDGEAWSYYSGGEPIATGTYLAVELKLEDADDAFPQYWILSQFVGVGAVRSESMVLSQFTAKQ